ncbi:MAG TPA: MotA/TolQ/ExbB proton channel family protein [Planctomycetota bacterium]
MKTRLFAIAAIVLSVAWLCAGQEVPPADPTPTGTDGVTGTWSPLLETYRRGGLIMWPLLAALLAGIGIACERMVRLRQHKQVPKEFEKDIVHIVDTRGVDAGCGRCLTESSALSHVLYAALLRYGRPPADLERVVIDETRRTCGELARNTVILGALSVLVILMGALGTSLGLIEYFEFAPMQSGAVIADALIPLAFALATATVLATLYFHFRAIGESISRKIEERAIDAVVTLDRKARQSIRLIDDIQEHVATKDMPAVKLDLEKELESVGREGGGIKTSITTHANLPIPEPEKTPLPKAEGKITK